MTDLTAEQLAQRILECRLLDNRQTNQVFSALGSRGVPVEEFKRFLLQHEHLTNWQLKRVEDGHKTGFFYGKWKVLYLVGAGTFARVYRSVHTRTGDVKAVKVLRNRYTGDMITRDRFMREAQTVMKLRHPNIVPIHEVENHRGRIYMVMDFIEGQNMQDPGLHGAGSRAGCSERPGLRRPARDLSPGHQAVQHPAVVQRSGQSGGFWSGGC